MKRKISAILSLSLSMLLSPLILSDVSSATEETNTYETSYISTVEESDETDSPDDDENLGSDSSYRDQYHVYQNGIALGVFGDRESAIEEAKKWANSTISNSGDTVWKFGDHKFSVFQSNTPLGSFNTKQEAISEAVKWANSSIIQNGNSIWKFGDHKFNVFQSNTPLGSFNTKQEAVSEAIKWGNSSVVQNGSTVWKFGDHKFNVFQSSTPLGSFNTKQEAVSEAIKWANSSVVQNGSTVWKFGDQKFTVFQRNAKLGSFDTKYGAMKEALKWANSHIVQNGDTVWKYVSFSPSDSANGTEVFYYSQLDPRWKNTLLGKRNTIGVAGCGPTSLATVISSLSKNKVGPVEMSKWTYKNGYYSEGAGSYHSLIPAGAKAFGLNVEPAGLASSQKLKSALSEGKMVVALMSRGHFTRTGHFIVLRGISKNGNILVSDPLSRFKSEKEWPISIIMNEARRGASAGGPFWIISN